MRTGKNHEGYSDPTASCAVGHLTHEEKQREKKRKEEKKRDKSSVLGLSLIHICRMLAKKIEIDNRRTHIMKIIAVMTQKGGVGKTMTASSLAYILGVEHGKRVLIADADQQWNISMSVSYTHLALSGHDGNVFTDDGKPKDIIGAS